MPEATAERQKADELERVLCWRRSEALEAGLTLKQANEFAESDTDMRWLRKLVELHCPPDLLAKIL